MNNSLDAARLKPNLSYPYTSLMIIVSARDPSRADSLKTNGMEAVRLMLGVALLLVIAGIIEGFILSRTD